MSGTGWGVGPADADGTLEARVGRILGAATRLGVVLVGAGSVLMLAAGVSPLDPSPVLTLPAFLGAVRGLRPEGLLWLGIVVLVGGPVLRVVTSAVGYARGGERSMVLVSLGILGVIAASVLVGLAAAASAGG